MEVKRNLISISDIVEKELYWLWLIIYSPDDEATVWSSERANNVGNEMKNFIVLVKQFLTLEKRFKPIPNVCDSNVSALFLVLWIDLLCCRLDFVVLFNTSDWIMETRLMKFFLYHTRALSYGHIFRLYFCQVASFTRWNVIWAKALSNEGFHCVCFPFILLCIEESAEQRCRRT